MSTYPAPYESPPEDDLRAAVAGWMTVTLALILSWILGFAAYHRIREFAPMLAAGADPDDIDPHLMVPGIGWGIAVLFLVLGAISVVRRKGRKAVEFGALIAIVVTAVAQFAYHLNGSVPQWPLYWGGVAVLALALLPATRRWVHRLPPPTGETVIGTVDTTPGIR